MDDQLKIIVQAAIDRQKTETQINAQIKQIKVEALRIGIEVDDKIAQTAIKEQSRLAKDALNNQKQSLEKILQLKTQIAQTDSTNRNTLNVLNRQLSAEQANYKVLSQEADKYNEIISKEERRKALTQETVALNDKLRTATAGKVDTGVQQQKKAVEEYNKTINDTLRSLNAIKNNATFKNNYNNMNVQSSVSSVQSLITSFKNLQIQMGSAKSPEALEAIRVKLDSLRQNFSTVSNEARSLEQILKSASSATKLTNDKSVLNNQITTWLKNNSKAADQFGESLKNIQKQIKTADSQQLKTLRGQFRSVQTEASAMGKTGNTTFEKLINNFQKFASWVGIGNIFMTGIRSIQNGLGYLKELDNALTLINITMPVTGKEMQNLADKSNEMAKELGVSTTAILKAATIYANANESAESILQKSQATVMLSAVSGIDTSTTADIIQGAINQFDLAEDSALQVSDIFQKVSENMAVDFAKGISEISQAIAVSGSVAADAGLSLEEYSSMIGTIVEKTRISGSTVGQALRTIFTRITKASSSGESTDEDISKAETSLRAVGIEVRKDKDTFRELDDILGDLAGKWETLTDVQRSNIAYEIAGTRQTSIVKSLLTNFDRYIDILGEAEDAAGTSAENQAIVIESLAGKLGTFTSTVQGLWQNANLTDTMKSAVDAGTGVVSILSTIIDKLGLVNTIIASIVAFNLTKAFIAPAVISQLSGIGSILGNFVGLKNAAVGLQSFNTALSNIGGITKLAQSSVIPLASSIDTLSYSQQALVLSSQKVNANMAEQILMQNGMTKSDASLILSKYGLVTTSREVSTAQLDELLTTTALNQKEKEAILISLGYKNSITGEIIPLQTLSAEKLTNALTTKGLSVAEAEAITTSLGFGTAQIGASVGVGALTTMIKAQVLAIGAWLFTNPVGWLILFAGAIAGTIALVNHFTVSLEEQQKITADLKTEYDEVTSKLSELNDELETTNSRMDELNNKDSLTFVEKGELQKLKDTTFELERQIALQKDLADVKQKEVADSVKKEYEKDFNDASEDKYYASTSEYVNLNTMSANSSAYGIETKLTESEYLDEQKKLFQDVVKEYDTLNQKKADGIDLTDTEIARLAELTSVKDSSSKFLLEDVSKLQGYIDDYGIDDEFSQGLKAQIEEIDRLLNPDVYKTVDFEKAIGLENVQEDVKKVNQALKDGNLSVNTFAKSFPELTAAFNENNISTEEAVSQILALDLAGKLLGDVTEDTAAEILTLDDTLKSVSDNVAILSSVQKELAEDGKLSIDTMQKLNEAGLSYDTVVGTNGESLRDLIIAQLDAEISTKRLALAQAQLNATSAASSDNLEDLSEYSKIVTQLDNELGILKNSKKVVIDTEYTSKEGDKTPESIKSFKTLEAKYQNYVNMKKMSEEDFMKWYDTAYKNAYRGYENSEEYVSDYRSAMEKVFAWQQERQKEVFDKSIESIDNQVEITTDTHTDLEGNKLQAKEYFQYIRDLYTQAQEEINNRISQILASGLVDNEEQLEELRSQLADYDKKIQELFIESVESEKEYIESVKDLEINAIDDRIDKIEEEKKAKEDAYEAEMDAIQDKIDKLNEQNDVAEDARDLEKAQLDLKKAQIALERLQNQHTRKVFAADGSETYRLDDEAIANAEIDVEEAKQKIADLESKAVVDALEKQKDKISDEKDKVLEDYDSQIAILEATKESQEKYYDGILERLDKLIDPATQTESNTDVYETVDTVTATNGVLANVGESTLADDTTTTSNTNTNTTSNTDLTGSTGRNGFTDVTMMEYLTSLGATNVNPAVLSSFMNGLGSSSANVPNALTSSQALSTTNVNAQNVTVNISKGGVVISNPVGDTDTLASEIVKNLSTAMTKQLYSNKLK